MSTVYDYLLDTNIISYLVDKGRAQNELVSEQLLRSINKESRLHVSVVTIGELEYGCEVHKKDVIRKNIFDFLDTRFNIINVTRHTAQCYGEIRAALFEKFSPKGLRHGLRPEQLKDPVTATELGIDENDLWLVSQAYERNLIFVTADKTVHLRDVVGSK